METRSVFNRLRKFIDKLADLYIDIAIDRGARGQRHSLSDIMASSVDRSLHGPKALQLHGTGGVYGDSGGDNQTYVIVPAAAPGSPMCDRLGSARHCPAHAPAK